MFDILLETCLLAASVAVVAVVFATHSTSKLYTVALYGLSLAFFVCYVLALFDVLTLNVGGTLIGLTLAIAAGITAYIRAKAWTGNDKSIFLVRFAVVIPAVLFVLVCLSNILLHLERAKNAPKPRPQTPSGSTPHTDSLKRKWNKLKPVAVVVLLLCSLSAFAQHPSVFQGLTPDCCLQTIKLSAEVTKWQAEYYRADSLYRDTYRTGEERSLDYENQIGQALSKQVAAERRADSLQTRVGELEADNRRWVPKTWAGARLRELRNGLAVAGAVALTVGTLTLLRP